ncbi:MAG: LL-diaminopimelate aminotransferase [Prochlorococcus marinus XMU1422]|uniref:LL-diaminopimelate aminotransferase n=1 Tax=unclassified Prochlorococcus TaxID=2627481 RepID=UPI00097CD1AA|nr:MULTISPECIES: LL-diaminopimelate aminotransferase [unclassified Prochlorococcus]MBO6990458.1 LL-diaminopimelate aminotransferase [Prochlorococcus marinus XMU1421]MBO7012874.1 LL-diaminopimelate aminotransferase [Prochlorococcus marinus XMU1422]MCR8542010.1 LL-diaminopimelate aminotransferase [Prochlorococcus marinus XMU1423]AQL30016.1 LL-diaminopimelate aminotransferase [Prochlorococcus sp. RS50]AQL33045.1 LL-diaminopimelate aminotransferase [Prochlorococcus sp. RS01]
MVQVNENYLKLKAGYLFPEIAKRVKIYSQSNKNAEIIKLGIGDVTEPLPRACIEAMGKALDEMGTIDGFRGYGPEQGYSWLREKISEHDFISRGCQISPEEIFVSDGSKCDSSNILDILGKDNSIAVTDPVYPVYVDSNVMTGRTGDSLENGTYQGLTYLAINEGNNFLPELPEKKVDILYLCFPNNPTGATINKAELKKWVDYALQNKSLILFDAAYEAFIQDNDIPHSIYEIEGAKDCAIEFRSFSKNAGFTGVRCAFTVIPKNLKGLSSTNEEIELWPLWNRRQSTKFNGVSYVVQKGAEAVYSLEGKKQVRDLIDFYMENAKIMKNKLQNSGYKVYGGDNAPYIWIKVPDQMTSWDFFDFLLQKVSVVGTPGSGFGLAGEGYFRLSAFNSRSNVLDAMERIINI